MACNAECLNRSIHRNERERGEVIPLCYKALKVELSAGVRFITTWHKLGGFLLSQFLSDGKLDSKHKHAVFMVNKQPARLNKSGPGGCTNKDNDLQYTLIWRWLIKVQKL